YLVVDLPPDRYERVLELDEQFAALNLGFVDAAVIAIAEFVEVMRIATTDRRDFGAVAARIPIEILP
ncbi:MAG TPA: VapC toxin family PIN domain ribonuclease, partial [Thermoanaerobaculia bacterium]|nr:VapC toxin family PIN domain ribonuclease [Thermoanaerobaculia bacterium]